MKSLFFDLFSSRHSTLEVLIAYAPRRDLTLGAFHQRAKNSVAIILLVDCALVNGIMTGQIGRHLLHCLL
jgi:hypothetical protein